MKTPLISSILKLISKKETAMKTMERDKRRS